MSNFIRNLESTLMNDFVSRVNVPLPAERCVIIISYRDRNYLCEWIPNTLIINHPHFLGCAKFLVGENEGLTLNAWNDQKYDFEFYKIVKI